ncbi:MAG: RNA polymerase sigma factor [Micropruina sp.]|uniref:RNA polymerase sigma factor n=1 Tax=Micropruina sp. TaxID=2737536 RepID=UPI0039E40C20
MEAIVEPAGPDAVDRSVSRRRSVDDRTRARFVAVYTQEHPRLVAFVLRRTGDRGVAEDVTAEVFRIAWERVGAGVPDSAWLFVTARNLTMAHHRATQRSADVRKRLIDAGLGRLDEPHERWGEQIEAALDALPPAQRELLTSHYWDGLSGAECAALAGCSVGAVWVRLHRARTALRIEFDKLKGE